MIFNVLFTIAIISLCGLSISNNSQVIMYPVLLIYSFTCITIIMNRGRKLIDKEYEEIEVDYKLISAILMDIFTLIPIFIALMTLFPMYSSIGFFILVVVSYTLSYKTTKKKEKNPFDFLDHEDKMKNDKEYRQLYELQQTRKLK